MSFLNGMVLTLFQIVNHGVFCSCDFCDTKTKNTVMFWYVLAMNSRLRDRLACGPWAYKLEL